MNDVFTVPEVNMVCIFYHEIRIVAIENLIAVLDKLEAELAELAISVLDKLSRMSDAEYAALELYPVFETDSE